MRYTRIEEIPPLRDPVLLVAFAGWNDAASAATAAGKALIEKLAARYFAAIDGEEFYDFTSTRPIVDVKGDTQVSLEWPSNSFYYHTDPALDRDIIVFMGSEPQLKWRTFTGEFLDLARECGVGLVVTLGAMLTDAPHSRAVPISGFATDQTLVERLRALQINPISYQGPTGILGVIHNICLRREMPSLSLWASVSHYLGIAENPKAAAALVHVLDDLLGLHLDLEDVDQTAKRFESQVDAIVSRSIEAAAYVKELERRADAALQSQTRASGERAELPPSEVLIHDLEEYLKRRRAQGSNGDDS